MSSRMRVTKGHSGNRRSHHSLIGVRLSICDNCGAKHERHKVCLECGFYRGKEIISKKADEKLVTRAESKAETKKEKKQSQEKKTTNEEK